MLFISNDELPLSRVSLLISQELKTKVLSGYPEPLPQELPKDYALRGGQWGFSTLSQREGGFLGSFFRILGVGRRILPRPLSLKDAKSQLDLLSGRRHQLYTSFLFQKSAQDPKPKAKLWTSFIKMKHLSQEEKDRILGLFPLSWSYGHLLGCCVLEARGAAGHLEGLPLNGWYHALQGEGFPFFKAIENHGNREGAFLKGYPTAGE